MEGNGIERGGAQTTREGDDDSESEWVTSRDIPSLGRFYSVIGKRSQL